MEILFLGLKNVFRNRRRSILNIIALGVGIFIMIIGMGWVAGYGTYVYGAIIDFQTGHVHILDKDYLDEERRLPLDLNVRNYLKERTGLLQIPDVLEASGRINYSLKVSNGRQGIHLFGTGIDAPHEEGITDLEKYIIEGSYLGQQRGILIGAPVAEKLNLSVGDTVFITAHDRYSVQNLTDLKVIGIFKFGYPFIDNNFIYTDLKSTQELLGLQDEVTRIVLRFDSGFRINLPLRLTREFLEGGDLNAYGWQEFAKETVSAVQADSGGFWMMLVIMYFLIFLGILNSMSMSIHERTGEIGTLRAIGMKRRTLIQMLLAEGFWTACIATIGGLLLALPFILYLQFTGIYFGDTFTETVPVPFGQSFHTDFKVVHFLVATGIGIAAALIGSIIPARRAAKIPISEAMEGNQIM